MKGTYLQSLSARQKILAVVALVGALLVVGLGLSMNQPVEREGPGPMLVSMSIRQIAPKLGVTGRSLARDLGLPLDVPKRRPLENLGISQERLDDAARHVRGHRGSTVKYYVYVALCLLGFFYLVLLGRPAGAGLKQRKSWCPRLPHLVVLCASVIIAGFMLGKSPNPMEGTVKVFKSLVGLYPSVAPKVAALAFFAVVAVIGNKLVCGWACPFGALQELIYHLPVLRKIKRRKVPFVVSNTIRAGLFIVTLLVLFGLVGGRKGFVVYHFVNPFNLFSFDVETVSVGVAIVAAMVLSLGFYRPFCQFLCPFGLLSWAFERLSIFRVKIDRESCTNCGACARACPLGAAEGRVAGKAFPADCFSCARCLNVCPVDAIRYGFVGKK